MCSSHHPTSCSLIMFLPSYRPMTALASILGCRLLLKFLTMTAGSPTSFYDSAHSDGINHMDATHMANQAGARGGVQFTSHLTKDSAVSSVDFDLEKGKGRAQEQQLVTTPQVQTPPVVQPITSIAADLDQWRPPANQVSVTWADEKASEMRAEPIVPRSPGESTLECVEEESSMAEGSSQTEFNDNGDSGVDAIDTEGGRAVSVTSSKSSEAVDSGTVAAEIQVRNAGVEVLPSTPSGKDTEQIRQWLIEGPTFGSPITTVPEEDEDVDEDDGESWFEKYDDNGRPKRLFQRRWKSDDAPQPYFVHQPHLGPPSQPIASAPRRAFTIPSVPIKSKSKEPFLYHSPRHALGLGIERGAQLPFQALLAASNPTPTTKKFGDWSSPRSRARSVPKPEPSTSANNNMKPTFRNPTTQLSLFMQRRQREKPNDGHDHPPNGGSTNNANDVTNTQATSTTPPSATIRPPSPPIPLTSAHFPRSPTYTGAGLGNRNKPRSPPASSQTPRVRRLRQLLSNPSALANPPPHLEALPSPNGAPPAPSIRGSLRLGRVTSRSGESITSEYETATICSASTGWMFEVDASTAIQTEDLGAEGYGFGRQVTSPYS
ncbi:hypothetical protein FRC03_008494 [Tulasnella sp. 419]|nr:hypothetical protein FRC03_008494 [Tulasnella sp. 419]